MTETFQMPGAKQSPGIHLWDPELLTEARGNFMLFRVSGHELSLVYLRTNNS